MSAPRPQRDDSRSVDPRTRFLTAELAEHVRDMEVDDLVCAGIRNGQQLRVSTLRTSFGAPSRAILAGKP